MTSAWHGNQAFGCIHRSPGRGIRRHGGARGRSRRAAGAGRRSAVPRVHPRRRRHTPALTETDLAVLRRRRAELRLYEGRPKAIGEQGELAPKRAYFRAHNLLTCGDGTPALKWGSSNAYTRRRLGQPIYDWTIVDRIFETYVKAGSEALCADGVHAANPVDQPRALSAPVDPQGEVRQDLYRLGVPTEGLREVGASWRSRWMKHCVEKYGRAEVEQVVVGECGTRPNIGLARRAGRVSQAHRLCDRRRALPNARVGGPDSAGSGGQWMRDFLEHQIRGKNFATGQIVFQPRIWI